MDTRAWLGLESTHNPTRWYLPVDPGVSTGHRFLFGGCGLGAAMSAMEGTTGRPVVWATAQYLSYAKTGSVMDIDVVVAKEGRAMTQARATGHVGGTEILTVNAALGSRDFDATADFVSMPEVAGPDDSPVRPTFSTGLENALHTRMSQRVAAAPSANDVESAGDLGPGRVAVWTRVNDLYDGSGPLMAVLGDYLPMGISMTMDRPVMSNSLDNTIRVIRNEPCEWYLLDITVDAVRAGVGHGQVHIWSPEGTLLATASQSAMVRKRPPEAMWTKAENQESEEGLEGKQG